MFPMKNLTQKGLNLLVMQPEQNPANTVAADGLSTCSQVISLSFLWKDFNNLYHLSVKDWHKCKYIFMFVQEKIQHMKGLEK